MPTIRRPAPAPRRTAAARPETASGRPPALVLPFVAAIALLAGGCAATPKDTDADFALVEDYADGSVSYTVQRGDRLGDIALEFTGDVALWKEIAASNGIDDPRSLRAGSVLRIPGELIPGYAESLAARAAEREERRAGKRLAAREVVPETRETPRAAPSGLAARRAAPVELSPVDVNRRFELSPLEENADAPAADDDRGATLDASDPAPPASRRIRVVGSYFPKGVYAQPASYSQLIMRVAPGTLFELDGEVGDWYGVVTENGIGYLRDVDGKVLEDDAGAALADARG